MNVTSPTAESPSPRRLVPLAGLSAAVKELGVRIEENGRVRYRLDLKSDEAKNRLVAWFEGKRRAAESEAKS